MNNYCIYLNKSEEIYEHITARQPRHYFKNKGKNSRNSFYLKLTLERKFNSINMSLCVYVCVSVCVCV